MKHARVLIVDSDKRLRSHLYTHLLDLEVFSDAVSNGSEALEYLRDRRYGLILLDLELGNNESYAILDHVRGLQAVDRPMILATAARESRPSVDPELVQIVMRKPLRLADVADMIRSCVGSVRDAVARAGERADGGVDLLGGDQHIVGVVS